MAAQVGGIEVEKTASPLSLPEPGGTFSFAVTVRNSLAQTVTVTSLIDDIYGDLALLGTCGDAVGTVLAQDESVSCSFDGPFTGNAGDAQTDVVTATATDEAGATTTDTDDAVVAITDVPPTVTLDKSAQPTTIDAPGGPVTFTVLITNTSGEAVTITELTDDVYGDLAGRPGTCATAVGTSIAAAAAITCSFTAEVSGQAGQIRTDIVTVEVVDDDGSTATADDDATVTLTDGSTPTTTTPTTTPPSTTPTTPPTTTPRSTPTVLAASTPTPQLAATGAETRITLSVAVGLVGLGLVLVGLGLCWSDRRRDVPGAGLEPA